MQCGSRESTEYILGFTCVCVFVCEDQGGQQILLGLENNDDDDDVAYKACDSSEQTLGASKG